MSAITIPEAPVASPLSKKDRILFLDAVRGIALLGILVMNSMAQGQSFIFYDKLNLNQPITGKNFWAWAIEVCVFEGTMRGLFSILFGAGTILLINRLEKTRGHIDAADIYFRRILWLLFFGVINAFIFLWPGDILYSYALCGLFLFPFRKLSPRALWIGVFLMLAFGTYRENTGLYEFKETISKGKYADAISAQHKNLSNEQKADTAKWHSFRNKYNSKGMMTKAADDSAKIQTTLPKLFVYIRDVNVDLQGRGFYNSWWDMLLFFFIGMALLKTGFLTGSSPNWQYILIAVLGIGIGLTINYFHYKLEYHSRFDGVVMTEKMWIDPYQFRRFVQTMGYLSLLILVYKVTPLRAIMNIFTPVGQMAFTNYLSQSIITSVIFYVMGWFGSFQRYQIYEIVFGIWVFQIVFSTIWLKYFLFGPFEWLWRSLTYQKAQPLIRIRENIALDSVSGTAANL